jgi:hypothetical protein
MWSRQFEKRFTELSAAVSRWLVIALVIVALSQMM